MIKLKILSTGLLFIFHLNLFAQSFEKSKDEIAKEIYVEYNHAQLGIIIKKIICEDTSISTKYELGLIVYRNTFSPSNFMEKWTHIVFEDKSTLSFRDSITLTYFQAGKHGYCFKHTLTENELSIFQSKRINYFSVAGKEKNLDKWQPDEIIKAFKKILLE